MHVPKGIDRLTYLSGLYEETRNHFSQRQFSLEQHRGQYYGSKNIDGSQEEASVVRNITHELIESMVSVNIPQPRVDAGCYSVKNDRNAKAIEKLCLRARDELPFEKLNDLDERYTYIYGGSVWLVEWDDSLGSEGRIGNVKLSLFPPSDFFPEAGVQDVGDMAYFFLRFITSTGEILRRYSLSEEDAARLLQNENGEKSEEIEVIICFYRNDKDEVSRFLYTSDIILEDTEDYYQRRLYLCKKCGKEQGVCTCQSGDFIAQKVSFEYKENALNNGFSLTPEKSKGKETSKDQKREEQAGLYLPYYRPKRFPIVIRKNAGVDPDVFGQSDCALIRPQQQLINKLETRIQQKLLRGGITPILPDDAELTLNNSIFGQIIRLKPGEDKSLYGVLDTTPTIAQDIEQSQRLYDQAKRILGITDSYLGIGDDTALSGKAKQIQIEQASGRLESKRRMKQSAYAEIDRLIFEYHLAYADEPRHYIWEDSHGYLHDGAFDRYDFLLPKENETYRYDDYYLFSADQNTPPEQQREALWLRNLENLKAGTLGDPANPMTLLRYWQCQERSRYPFARDHVEHFQALTKVAPAKETATETEKFKKLEETSKV